MNRNLSQTGIAAGICALACAYSSGASAAESLADTQPATPAFLAAGGADAHPVQIEAVDDDVLAHQTGKYAGNDMISGMVLNVLSQWQLPNGATAAAQGTLTVEQSTSNQLSASVQTSAKVTDPVPGGTTRRNSGATPDTSVSGGQNVAVNGVSQVTQVAGNSNIGMNSATIDYNNSATQQLTGANSPSASASNANGTITAGIAFGNNGINVTLQTPAGRATQNIMPSNTAQAGSIAQLLQIAGNNQQVANQLQLSLQTQQLTAQMIRQTGVLQALRNIR